MQPLYSHFIAAVKQMASDFCGVEGGERKSMVRARRALAGRYERQGLNNQFLSRGNLHPLIQLNIKVCLAQISRPI